MKKPIPTFATDKDAQAFVATADLSQFDLSGGQMVQFELKPKDKAVSLRLPEPMLAAIRERARQAGIPYQRFIRMALEKALATSK
ncbi:BrnA antitoxin family protein [uncultured Alsobacter sp.]|uniref:BrnA antitoxin family protein n=1 Tax=uncultured Alsobacter sp. TaxID=1748258 RepID=UPI0025CC92C9|nr:BrnA antitoxin family protein [uncultured Alsobacter sp.]